MFMELIRIELRDKSPTINSIMHIATYLNQIYMKIKCNVKLHAVVRRTVARALCVHVSSTVLLYSGVLVVSKFGKILILIAL